VNTVELIVVTDVVVTNVVELVVVEVTMLDVDVSVELIVVVAVAVCAGDVRGVGLAKDGDVTSRPINRTSIIPSVIASICNRVDRLVEFRNAQLFLVARLMTPTATRPTKIPATIDSHGKPGIPGICCVLLLNTVEVSVLVLVKVEVERELLVLVSDVVMTLVEVEVVVVVALVDVVVNVDVLPPLVEVETIVVVPAPPAP